MDNIALLQVVRLANFTVQNILASSFKYTSIISITYELLNLILTPYIPICVWPESLELEVDLGYFILFHVFLLSCEYFQFI